MRAFPPSQKAHTNGECNLYIWASKPAFFIYILDAYNLPDFSQQPVCQDKEGRSVRLISVFTKPHLLQTNLVCLSPLPSFVHQETRSKTPVTVASPQTFKSILSFKLSSSNVYFLYRQIHQHTAFSKTTLLNRLFCSCTWCTCHISLWCRSCEFQSTAITLTRLHYAIFSQCVFGITNIWCITSIYLLKMMHNISLQNLLTPPHCSPPRKYFKRSVVSTRPTWIFALKFRRIAYNPSPLPRLWSRLENKQLISGLAAYWLTRNRSKGSCRHLFLVWWIPTLFSRLSDQQNPRRKYAWGSLKSLPRWFRQGIFFKKPARPRFQLIPLTATGFTQKHDHHSRHRDDDSSSIESLQQRKPRDKLAKTLV